MKYFNSIDCKLEYVQLIKDFNINLKDLLII